MFEEMKKQNFWEKTKRFLEPLWSNKWVTLYQIIYFVFQYSFGVIFIFFVKDITEILSTGDAQIFILTLWKYFFYFSISFIGALVTFNGWTYPNDRYRETIEGKYIKGYVLFDTNYSEKNGTGKSISILSRGIKTWGILLGTSSIYLVKIVLSLGVTMYLLSQVNYMFVLLFIFLIIVGGILGIFLNIKTIQERNKRIELDNIWSKSVVKIIMSKIEILQGKRIDYEIEKLYELQEGKIYYNKKMSPYLVPFYILGNLITGIMLFIVYIKFGSLYYNGELSLGFITGITGAFLLMNNVLIDFLDFIKNFGRDFSEIQNLWDFYDYAPQIEGYEQGKTFEYKTGEIELKNIFYGYDENKNVFENFSLKLEGGKITALVGPSGGGKTTLVKLIAGYIRANAGEILIDNQKLSETSLKSYYSEVGYLTQEPSVFDGTIRENLMYALGDEGVSESKIKEIIDFSQCQFIYDLPSGLETEIGERGIKLSGGQKQRLAIAKIFLKNPKIIILDEPTSALDSVSEMKISEALKKLFENRTVIIIAHRLQTVKHADEILVIENGKILERGTHKDLIKEKGFYKQMLDLQSGF